MRRIFVQIADTSSVSYYRAYLPAAKCYEQLLSEGIELIADIQLDMNHKFDAYIFQRPPTARFFPQLNEIKQRGSKLIWSADDLVSEIPRYNPAYGQYNCLGVQERFQEALKLSDMVLTSTDTLLDELGMQDKGVVCRNALNMEDYKPQPRPEEMKDQIRLLWQGSPTHREDLEVIDSWIPLMLENHKEVKVLYFGDLNDPYITQLPNFEFVPPAPFQQYFGKFMSLHGDIGLAPLKYNRFNSCKSNLKFLEYSLAGMATVASRFDPYQSDIFTGYNGDLAYSDEWYLKVLKLVKDKERRAYYAKNAYEDVKNYYSWDSELVKEEWMSFWRSCV